MKGTPMKEIWFNAKVLLFGILLFAFQGFYDQLKAYLLESPPPFGLLGILIPAFLLFYYLWLVHFPLRYHEPFVKPYKGFDPNFKVVRFNPSPLLCLYFCFSAILQSMSKVNGWVFLDMLLAYFFFRICDKHGFQLIQSWYETTKGKVLRVVRW